MGDDTTIATKDPGAKSSLVLVVVGDGRVRRVELPERGAIVIGRDAGADLVLEDGAVSKRHAKVTVSSQGVSLVDLGSKNGTRIDGAPISVETALELGRAFEIGAATFLLKRISKASETSASNNDGPILVDPAMRAVSALIDQVAPANLPVLIQGETGSGKEVIASTLHARSRRSAGPLIRINCAALPLALLESELFGNEAGAFTGATGKRKGLLEEAHGGTLFLDEIGELPLDAQAKVLRALEDGAFFRVGGRQAVKVDVRFVAATNRDLSVAARQGAFRSDLYYRLNGITISVPPLRQRPSEIIPLAKLFAERATVDAGFSTVPSIDRTAEQALLQWPWPGNVRELRNVMQRAVLLAGGETISVHHLLLNQADPHQSLQVAAPMPAMPNAPQSSPGPSSYATMPPPPPPSHPGPPPSSKGLFSDLEAHERARIEEALRACAGNQTRAAEMLGISRRTLVSRLEKYGFDRPLKK